MHRAAAPSLGCRNSRSEQLRADFDNDGYAVLEDVISPAACHELLELLPAIESSGSRTKLSLEPVRALARGLRETGVRGLIHDLVGVECILFRKSREHNWAVRLHRDTVLPIQGSGEWPASGTKEGMDCVQPPRSFLDRCVAVRLHLDGAPLEDISVVPGSHKDSTIPDRSLAIAIPVSPGGALVMRPTLAHASSKLESPRPRRVLHFVFAPREIPPGYHWYHSV